MEREGSLPAFKIQFVYFLYKHYRSEPNDEVYSIFAVSTDEIHSISLMLHVLP